MVRHIFFGQAQQGSRTILAARPRRFDMVFSSRVAARPVRRPPTGLPAQPVECGYSREPASKSTP